MGWFSRSKKTYAEKNPQFANIYNTLTPQQKTVLDNFSYRAEHRYKADMKVALTRIAELHVIPRNPGLSSGQIKARAKQVHGRAKVALANAPLVTNVAAGLFALDDFYNGDMVKTVWNLPSSNKGSGYIETRQAVEENAFGYQVDWAVPIAEAEANRPVYACLNTVQHPLGAATAYGSVVLEYKPAVKSRCTYIAKDTFDTDFHFARGSAEEIEVARNKICTNARIECLMASISNSQLKALCEHADGAYVVGNHPPNYIEAHVHGGIRFSRDLAAIRVSRTGVSTIEKDAKKAKRGVETLLYLISEFAEKHGVPATLVGLSGAGTPL